MPITKFNLTRMFPVIPPNIKEFDPSYVTRYAIVSELVKEAEKKESKQLTILDVGGYNGALGNFLPDNDLTILDVAEDKKTKNYVRASGSKMPFKDNAFDIVVTTDTLEHIPSADRDTFIKEILRVSKKYCFLAAPFGTPKVEAAELLSDNFYKSLTGESYIWLKEHREYVLPTKTWLSQILKQQNVFFCTFDHTSIDLWVLMLCASFFLANNIKPVDSDLAEKLTGGNKAYLNQLAFSDFPKQGYRGFFVISKQETIEVELPNYSFDKASDMFNYELQLLGTSLQELTHNIGISLSQIGELNNQNMLLYKEKAKLNKNISNLIKDKLSLDAEIKAINLHLDAILNSKTYKLALKLAKAKRKVMRNGHKEL